MPEQEAKESTNSSGKAPGRPAGAKNSALTFRGVMAAHKAIDTYVYETPMISSNALRNHTGHQEVLLKCENLQRGGSYHFRGMVNKVIKTKENDLGVETFLTHSTGNSGTALACAAKDFQSVAHVVVPKKTNHLITSSIEHYDGKFYPIECTLESRTENLKKLYDEMTKQKIPAQIVHPYDDDDIMAGFGTVGLELMEQTNCGVDCVVAAGGGGGLLAGVSVAVKGMKPHVAVFAAVPKDLEDDKQLFKRGEFELRPDAMVPKGQPMSGKYRMTDKTYNLVTKHVDGTITVTEKQIRSAFRYVYERCKLVIDTNAATAVAAVLSCPPALRKYRRVCIIISGGNVDLNDIPRIVSNL